MKEERNYFRMILATLAACLFVYCVGNNTVQLWDRDEPRNAQASRQMLQSGDWVVPHFLDTIRTAKPIFIYWCQASAMAVFGDNTFAARFPSVVAMMLLLIILARVLWKHDSAERAFWTVLIFSTSAIVIASAKMCLTDSVLLLWTTIAQLCLFAIWNGARQIWIAPVMWVAIGLAFLTKGPVVLGVQITTLISLAVLERFWVAKEDRRGWKWLWQTQPLVGIVIVTAVAGPWFYLVNQRAPQMLQQAATRDIWQRILKPLEGHAGPPGYHFLTVWGTFMPWCLFLPATAWYAWKNRAKPDVRFAMAATLGPWIMMEIVQTKLPHYILPIFPPMSFLAASMLIAAIRREHAALSDRWAMVGIGLWALVLCAFGVFPWIALKGFPETPKYLLMLISVCVVIGAISVFVRFLHGRTAEAAETMGIGMLIIIAIIYGYILPRLDFLRTSQRVAQSLIDLHVTGPGQVVMFDYMEPSLAFHQGGTIRETVGMSFHPRFDAKIPRFVVLTSEVWDGASEDYRSKFVIRAQHKGFNYADRMRIENVMIVERK